MTSAEKSEFDFGTLFGILLGFGLSSLVWTINLPVSENKNWIYEYQTLVTGIIALLTGAISIWFLSKQMRQVETFQSETRERELRAVRPALAFVLVELLQYAEGSYKALRSFYKDLIPTGHGTVEHGAAKLTLPAVPNDAVGALRENLRFGSPSAVAVIAQMISKLQIQQSRLAGLLIEIEQDDELPLQSLYRYSTDCLELASWCNRLFPYSRGELEEIDTSIKRGHLVGTATGIEAFESQDPLMLFILEKFQD